VEKVRRAEIGLTYSGKDITREVSPHVKSLIYRDVAHGKADTLEVVFEDRDRLFQGPWMMERGGRLSAEIRVLDWFGPGDVQALRCGGFAVDEVELSGPPDEVRVKAVSALTTTALRLEKRTRAWENVSLRTIAGDIASRHGLQCFFEGEDVAFKRVDQREESDLSFLKRLCEAHGFQVKVAEEKLTLYEGKAFDAKAPAFKVSRGTSWVISYSFRGKSFEVYRACEVRYWDPETKSEKVYRFEPGGASRVGHVLKVNERVESLSDAERRARAELRRANRVELSGEIVMAGCPGILGGLNLGLSGFGAYDGVWAVEEAEHRISSSGYTVRIKIRKTVPY